MLRNRARDRCFSALQDAINKWLLLGTATVAPIRPDNACLFMNSQCLDKRATPCCAQHSQAAHVFLWEVGECVERLSALHEIAPTADIGATLRFHDFVESIGRISGLCTSVVRRLQAHDSRRLRHRHHWPSSIPQARVEYVLTPMRSRGPG